MRLSTIAAMTTALLASVGPACAAVHDRCTTVDMLNDQSGVYADGGRPGPVVVGWLAVEDAGGKVLGVPVEVIGSDHQNKANVASAAAQR